MVIVSIGIGVGAEVGGRSVAASGKKKFDAVRWMTDDDGRNEEKVDAWNNFPPNFNERGSFSWFLALNGFSNSFKLVPYSTCKIRMQILYCSSI